MKDPPKEKKKQWVKPCLKLYGDMATLTKQSCSTAPNCTKPKTLGFGDDFSSNISTVG